MAHIACITNGLTGLLLASLEMARRLEADGHHITYIAPPSARDAAIREGLSFEELPDLEVDAERAMTDFAVCLEAFSFDLALIDTELPEAVLSAQAIGLRTVLLNTWMSIWKYPGLPPLHRQIQPGVGFQGTSFGMELAWLRHRINTAFEGCCASSLARPPLSDYGDAGLCTAYRISASAGVRFRQLALTLLL